MCLHDWRAGRLIRTQYTGRNIFGSPLIIPPNPNRVGIQITWAADVTFSDGASIAIDGVIVAALNIGTPSLMWSLVDHGDVPTKEFVVTDILGATNVGVIEMFLPEDMLSAGLNEFISQYAIRHGAFGR